MDCVSDNGDLFIGYSASVAWGWLRLSYSLTLRSYADGRRAEISTARQAFPPHEVNVEHATGSEWEWNCPPLSIQGFWRATAKPLSPRILFSGPDGQIVWTCHVPAGEASINGADTFALSGVGYMEHLHVTIPPWRLPMEELRWGRFLSGDDALVWIQWSGVQPVGLLLYNGKEQPDPSISDDEVSSAEVRLILIRNLGRVVQQGELGGKALSGLSYLVRWLIPRRILETVETKWLSPAELYLTRSAQPVDVIPAKGWALHECVRFPKSSQR